MTHSLTTYYPLSLRSRVVAILQLCISFTMILWYLGIPFTEQLYEEKKTLSRYQFVMEHPEFSQLTAATQAHLLNNYNYLRHEKSVRSFGNQMAHSVHLLLFETPSFLRAWLFLSVMIPIMILLRTPGAGMAGWLLPLLVVCYGFGVIANPPPKTQDESFFPSETLLMSRYAKEALSSNILKQHQQLKDAWKQYLISEWVPKKTLSNFAEGEGELYFYADYLRKYPLPQPLFPAAPRESLLTLLVYFIWNSLLACFFYRDEF